MKKISRIISLAAIIALLCALLLVPAGAASDEAVGAGDILFAAGFLSGGDSGLNLDREPTRVEAVAAFLKLMGLTDEVADDTDEIPFTDVPEWAVPYVSVMYKNGWTNGVSEDRFGSDSIVNANQFYTFVLRGLGYQDGEDFDYSEAAAKAQELGIIGEATYNALAEKGSFDRGDMAVAMYSALNANEAGSDITLAERLLADERISEEACEMVLSGEIPEPAEPEINKELLDFLTKAQAAESSLTNFSADMDMEIAISVSGVSMTMDATTSVKFVLNGDSIELFMDMSMIDPTSGEAISTATYMDGAQMYMKLDGEWTAIPEVEGMEEMMAELIVQAKSSASMLDLSVLDAYKDMTITTAGGEVTLAGKIDMSAIMDSLDFGSMLGEDISADMSFGPINAKIVYDAETYMPKVMDMDIDMTVTAEGETVNMKAIVTAVCYDYGTTAIELEDGLKALIEE